MAQDWEKLSTWQAIAAALAAKSENGRNLRVCHVSSHEKGAQAVLEGKMAQWEFNFHDKADEMAALRAEAMRPP